MLYHSQARLNAPYLWNPVTWPGPRKIFQHYCVELANADFLGGSYLLLRFSRHSLATFP